MEGELYFAGRRRWFRGVAEEVVAKLCLWLCCLDLVTHPSFLARSLAIVLQPARSAIKNQSCLFPTPGSEASCW